MKQIASGLLVCFALFAPISCRKSAADITSPVKPASSNEVIPQKIWPTVPLRGFVSHMVAPSNNNTQDPGQYLSEAQIQKLKNWKINLIRISINIDYGSIWDTANPPPPPVGDPLAPYRKNLDGLSNLLDLAAKYHIYIIPVASPLGRTNLLYEAEGGYAFNLYSIWEHIASNYGTNQWLLAYDLLNEPNTVIESTSWHSDVLPKLVAKIRAIDSNTYVAVEPWKWGGDSGFATLVPLSDAKAIYSFHFYYPNGYTHQGIQTYLGPDFTNRPYPGMLSCFGEPHVYVDKDYLETRMSNVIRFQQTYNVPVWVGEFGVIRHAPGGWAWIKDTIALFEKHSFSWTYYNYRGWSGLNPTFSSNNPHWGNNSDGSDNTDRLQELISGWSINHQY